MPLCYYPHVLQFLQSLSGYDLNREIDVPEPVQKELDHFQCSLETRSPLLPSTTPSAYKVYTDASTYGLAAMFPETDDHKDSFVCGYTTSNASIFFKELAAAFVGVIGSPKPAVLMVDNMAVLYAVAKGHSKVPTANVLIRKMYQSMKLEGCQYVRSEDNPADRPSRGVIPYSWIHQEQVIIPKSNFLRQ